MRRHPSHTYRHMQEMQNRLQKEREERKEREKLVEAGNAPLDETAGSSFGTAEDDNALAEEPEIPGSSMPCASPGESADDLKAKFEDERLRMAAEMENFKKRLSREYQEQLKFAAEKVLNDLLPSLDNMDLALQYGGNNEACRDMLQGIAMTRKLLDEALSRHGLSRVGHVGEEFDPNKHEAVGFESNSEFPAGHVARVLQNGYKLNDRLLRPAKVMVNQ